MRLPRTDEWTPRERRAVATLIVVWLAGSIAGWTGLDRALGRAAGRTLHPPRPSPAALAASVAPGDPRPGWYRAALALRAEEAIARSGPERIDPNAASRAEWDRLPGIGPVTAIAIVARRETQGRFRGPADLLAVRGIGPRTMERLAPFLDWGQGSSRDAQKLSDVFKDSAPPDLNRVDEAFLRGLSGFGPKLAHSLVRERRARGGFRDWSEVADIDGIGPARLAVLQKATRLRGTDPTGAEDP